MGDTLISEHDKYSGDLREPGWGTWVLLAVAMLGAVAGVIGSLGVLFDLI